MSDNQDILEFPVVENFSPIVNAEIYGITKNTKFVAIIDTGYEGFLQIPLATGIKANLRLWGIRSWNLADNSKVKMLECIGKIRFAGKDLTGIISLSETSEDCLLGMQFLEELKMDFTVSLTRKKAIFQTLPKRIDEEAKESIPKTEPIPEKPSEKVKMPEISKIEIKP